ncbi:MAG TPA: hypothetical protein VKB51_16125 [bacterium]|nr:hypothetical protein [bacterium]
MKSKTLVIVGLIVVFAIAIGVALLREVNRDKATLAKSISGVVEVDPTLAASGQADVVRTDRLVLLLVDPKTQHPVALKFVTPLVPPQTIRIGQAEAENGATLKGPYEVVGITDKDGEIFKVTPGEIYGRSAAPVALGTEQFHLVLNEPFHGTLSNGPEAAGSPAPAGPMAGTGAGPMEGSAGPLTGPENVDPARSIEGTITVSKQLASNIEPSDHLVILMFDPDQPRPVAFKIIPHALLPQRFVVSLPPGTPAKKAYNLHVVTDKDNNPFGAAPGELVGRSSKPIPLGTTDLKFELDQPYTR